MKARPELQVNFTSTNNQKALPFLSENGGVQHISQMHFPVENSAWFPQKYILLESMHAFFWTVNLLLHKTMCFQSHSSFYPCKVADAAHRCAVDYYFCAVPSTQTLQVPIEVHGLVHQSSCSWTLIFNGLLAAFFLVIFADFRKNRVHFLNRLDVFAVNKTKTELLIFRKTICNIWRLFLEMFTCCSNLVHWTPGEALTWGH